MTWDRWDWLDSLTVQYEAPRRLRRMLAEVIFHDFWAQIAIFVLLDQWGDCCGCSTPKWANG